MSDSTHESRSTRHTSTAFDINMKLPVDHASTQPMHLFSQSHDLSSLIPFRPKRRQVKNACVNCQKACKKCSDARPCLRCITYDIPSSCVDSTRKERRRGFKRGPYKKRDVQDDNADASHSQPLLQMEHEVEALSPPSDSSAPRLADRRDIEKLHNVYPARPSRPLPTGVAKPQVINTTHRVTRGQSYGSLDQSHSQPSPPISPLTSSPISPISPITPSGYQDIYPSSYTSIPFPQTTRYSSSFQGPSHNPSYPLYAIHPMRAGAQETHRLYEYPGTKGSPVFMRGFS